MKKSLLLVSIFALSFSSVCAGGKEKRARSESRSSSQSDRTSPSSEVINLGEVYAKRPDLFKVEVPEKSELKIRFAEELEKLGWQGVAMHLDGAAIVKIARKHGFDASCDITSLNLGNAQITSLDVSELTCLKKLFCLCAPLTHIDVSGCLALEKLMLLNGNLTSLDVSGLTKLQELGLSGNQLASLNVVGCVALKELALGDNTEMLSLQEVARLSPGDLGIRCLLKSIKGLADLKALQFLELDDYLVVGLEGLSKLHALQDLRFKNQVTPGEKMQILMNIPPGCKVEHPEKNG